MIGAWRCPIENYRDLGYELIVADAAGGPESPSILMLISDIIGATADVVDPTGTTWTLGRL